MARGKEFSADTECTNPQKCIECKKCQGAQAIIDNINHDSMVSGDLLQAMDHPCLHEQIIFAMKEANNFIAKERPLPRK